MGEGYTKTKTKTASYFLLLSPFSSLSSSPPTQTQYNPPTTSTPYHIHNFQTYRASQLTYPYVSFPKPIPHSAFYTQGT